MTVSKLIKFKDDLIERQKRISEGLEIFVDQKAVSLKIAQINNFTVDYNDDVHAIINMYENLVAENQKISDQLTLLINKVDADIRTLASKTFADITYKTHFAELGHKALFPIINTELIDVLRVRMHQYSDWRYPGLQLNVQEKQYVDVMTACDPLYLLGDDLDRVKLVVKDYPEAYQNRLRLYTNDNWNILPEEQFGFVLAWNYFEYCSMFEIKEQLQKVMSLLRPGGVVMFSYNNCELFGSAEVAERGAMNYNSAHDLIQICKDLGYEVIALNDVDTRNWDFPWISWAEIKRPGELNTVKAHQVLGKIIPKNY